MVKGKKPMDFRPIHFNQIFTNIAAGTTSAATLRDFPGGAVILGITASAVIPVVVKADQYYADGAAAPLDSTLDRLKSNTPGNRDLFALDFAYTNDEQLTPAGPIIADALLGSGRGTEFPARELYIEPAQGLLARVQNLITTQLISGAAAAAGILFPITVHICYKAMVLRAQG